MTAGHTDRENLPREQAERFARMRERAENVRDRLARNSVTATDGRGVVSVTVGSGGVMQSIRFGPRATQMRPSELSAVIMRTYGQACREAAAQSQQILGGLVGADSPTMRLMRDAVPADPDALRERDDR
ncbi:MAG TPA: YbaB/EbfC family nucleoid-associated protein, partial [Micromonosporaceae bacterium]